MTIDKLICLACAPLLFVLAIPGAMAAAAQELPVTETAEAVTYPNRGAYAHSYRIREDYDRFTDSMTVKMNLSIGGGTGRVGRFLSRIAHRAGVSGTNLEFAATGEGNPFRDPPAIVQIIIERDYSIEYGDDGLLEAEPLRLITDDGQRYSFETRLADRVRTTTDEDIEEQRESERKIGVPVDEQLILVFYEDRFAADVPTTVLIELASAAQVDGRIGDREFVLGDEEIQALRDFASRLAPDPSFGPVSARELGERAAAEADHRQGRSEELETSDDGPRAEAGAADGVDALDAFADSVRAAIEAESHRLYDCAADPVLAGALPTAAADTAGLGALISVHFPGYRLSTEADLACATTIDYYDMTATTVFGQEFGSGAAWWVHRGDHTADGREDVITSLTRLDDPSSQIVVAMQGNGRNYRIADLAGRLFGVYESDQGRYVAIHHVEASGERYFWDGEAFASLQASDVYY